ncbi:MAG: nucleotidyltransferase domain-containing protein [Deltaproteobacteria bacterium]|nr:nucleotidyltransferase domain-containing protein [Deltaproteobacteria bacterium]
MRKFQSLPPDILNRLDLLAEALSAHDQVVFAYLFGGLATGTVKPLSDVDIAVWVNSAQSIAETKLDLIGVIAKTLGTDEFDLVILNSASLSLAGRILRQRRVLVDKDPQQRHLFESLTNRKFFDFSRKEEALLRRRFPDGR